MSVTRQPALADTGEERPLIVTTSWDDGHPADMRVAEMLARHGIAGTFYVPSRNAEGRPVMRATEVAQLARHFEIGGHTEDHVSLTRLPPDAVRRQLVTNKQQLEDLLGLEVPGFAYVRGHHNRMVRQLVAQAGFRYARTVKNLADRPGTDPYRVPTTIQFFCHSTSTLLRNFLSGGPGIGRTRILQAARADGDLPGRCVTTAQACGPHGGHFHLWGHSWELAEHDLWQSLDDCLRRLRDLNARFVTNAGWCASLTRTAGTVARAAPADATGGRPSSRNYQALS
jgi:peptidoglycan/xylan/chitin deacetylase (PgdA/CDA1 family)